MEKRTRLVEHIPGIGDVKKWEETRSQKKRSRHEGITLKKEYVSGVRKNKRQPQQAPIKTITYRFDDRPITPLRNSLESRYVESRKRKNRNQTKKSQHKLVFSEKRFAPQPTRHKKKKHTRPRRDRQKKKSGRKKKQQKISCGCFFFFF